MAFLQVRDDPRLICLIRFFVLWLGSRRRKRSAAGIFSVSVWQMPIDSILTWARPIDGGALGALCARHGGVVRGVFEMFLQMEAPVGSCDAHGSPTSHRHPEYGLLLSILWVSMRSWIVSNYPSLTVSLAVSSPISRGSVPTLGSGSSSFFLVADLGWTHPWIFWCAAATLRLPGRTSPTGWEAAAKFSQCGRIQWWTLINHLQAPLFPCFVMLCLNVFSQPQLEVYWSLLHWTCRCLGKSQFKTIELGPWGTRYTTVDEVQYPEDCTLRGAPGTEARRRQGIEEVSRSYKSGACKECKEVSWNWGYRVPLYKSL